LTLTAVGLLVVGGCHRERVVRTMGVDVEIRLLDTRLLEEVKSAIEAFVKDGDPAAVTSLVAMASQTLSQADNSGESAIAGYLAEASVRLLNGEIPTSVFDERTGERLGERSNIVGYQAQRSINRYLVFFLCTQPFDGSRNAIVLSRGDLAEYVRSRSQWLDEMLSMSNELLWAAECMQPGLGSDAWLLNAEESSQVLEAISRVEPPKGTGRTLIQYNALRRMFEVATQTRNRRILLTMF